MMQKGVSGCCPAQMGASRGAVQVRLNGGAIAVKQAHK